MIAVFCCGFFYSINENSSVFLKFLLTIHKH